MRGSLSWPIPVSERISIVYIDRENIERDGHTLVAVSGDRRTVIPVGKTSAIFLGPDSTLSHAAAALCALEQTLLIGLVRPVFDCTRRLTLSVTLNGCFVKHGYISTQLGDLAQLAQYFDWCSVRKRRRVAQLSNCEDWKASG